MNLDPVTTSRLLCSLADASAQAPAAQKLLVARVLRTGHELLGALGTLVPGHGEWSATTPRNLALDLVTRELAREEWQLADDLDEIALLDDALDAALAEKLDERFTAIAQRSGFRTVVHEAVRTLRLAGVGSDQLAGVEMVDAGRQRLLVRTLAGYEQRLAAERLADLAEVFRRAVAAVEAGRLPAGRRLYLVPGLRLRGWAGRFVVALEARGAETLSGDPTVGLEPAGPTLWHAGNAVNPLSWLHAPRPGVSAAGPDLFAATSPRDELREVLRRVVDQGLFWDQVEIITADPSYPALLDGIARGLDIPVDYATGLPATRTRAGRAVAEFLARLAAEPPAALTSAAEIAGRAGEFLAQLPADPVQKPLLDSLCPTAASILSGCGWTKATRRGSASFTATNETPLHSGRRYQPAPGGGLCVVD